MSGSKTKSMAKFKDSLHVESPHQIERILRGRSIHFSFISTLNELTATGLALDSERRQSLIMQKWELIFRNSYEMSTSIEYIHNKYSHESETGLVLDTCEVASRGGIDCDWRR